MKNVGQDMAHYLNQDQRRKKYADIIRRVKNDPDVRAFFQQNQGKLDPDAVNKGMAKLYEFFNEKEKIANHEETFASGYYPRLIVNNHLIDVTYEPQPEKVAADAAAAKAALVDAAHMPKDFKDARLDALDTAGREEALGAALTFVNNYVASPKKYHQGFYLTGSYGVGKTYLLGGMANELADYRVPTLILHVPTFSVEMRDAISDNSVLDRIRKIEAVPILVFDDIGGETPSPWFRDDVLGVILQYRMQERLATFFSSNLSMANLQEFMATGRNGQDDSLKSNRIMARIKFLAREIQVNGPDRRAQLANSQK